MVKEKWYDKAVEIFAGSGLNITKGKKHLGAIIGSMSFKEVYMMDNVSPWVLQINNLSEIAKTNCFRYK